MQFTQSDGTESPGLPLTPSPYSLVTGIMSPEPEHAFNFLPETLSQDKDAQIKSHLTDNDQPGDKPCDLAL